MMQWKKRVEWQDGVAARLTSIVFAVRSDYAE